MPHFGEDEDIKFSKQNIANAEAIHGTWTAKRDGNGAWILPSVDSNKFGNFKGENNWPSPMMPSLVQTDADVKMPLLVQTDSKINTDPMCSSVGCMF